MADDKVADFVAITNASESTAAFYLESCGGSVEQAVQSFFDNGGAEMSAPTAAQPASGGTSLLADAAAARAARSTAPGGGDAAAARPSGSRSAGGSGGRRTAAGNVRGLGDIGGEEEDEEDDDFNDYYVGGDKSGQIVRGAPEDRRPAGNVDDIFEGARAAGAQQGSVEDMVDEREGSTRFTAFSGSARTLAGGEVPTANQQRGRHGPERRIVKIVFYANGIFTVDDAEPRRMDDPANLPFMEAIMRGQLPPELDPGDPTIQASYQWVNVNLMRSGEDYTPPAQPKVKAFSGTGYKLSGDAGAGTSATAAAGPPPGVSPGTLVWEGADTSKPTTSIQLRLADGSRLRAEFNLHHTVGDIRRFIRASRPDVAARPFRLATAFPAQQLDDDSATIEAAGLANSVIIQKM